MGMFPSGLAGSRHQSVQLGLHFCPEEGLRVPGNVVLEMGYTAGDCAGEPGRFRARFCSAASLTDAARPPSAESETSGKRDADHAIPQDRAACVTLQIYDEANLDWEVVAMELELRFKPTELHGRFEAS